MSETAFMQMWDTMFEEVYAFELVRRGKEVTMISRLTPTPKAAALLLEKMVSSGEPLKREAAAHLAGFLAETGPLDVLQRLFHFEVNSNLGEATNALNAQQVVRAIVLAAARFARDPRAREAGLAVCREVIERTINGGAGEYWAPSPYAMVTLVRHQAPDAQSILDRWAAWGLGEPPAYVLPTSLEGERSCARALLAGNENAIKRVDWMLDRSDDEGMVAFPARMQSGLDQLLALAAEIG